MRVKIAHIVTQLDLGGAQHNTLHTAKSLDPGRFDVVLVCGSGGVLDSEIRADSKLRTVFFDSLRRKISPFYDLLAFLELTKFLLEEKPLIVHTHSSKAGILGRFAAALAGVPIIIHTYHGFGFHDRQRALYRNLAIMLERMCSRLTHALVFVSRANISYAVLHGLVRAENAVLIRSGVALSDFPAKVDARTLKATAGIGVHKLLVLSVGNLKPQKNAADFVAVAAKVLASVPDVRFAFIGDGPQRQALEARVFSLGLSGRVMFLGWRRDTAQWLAAADVYMMTSLWEGLPRALIEAMKSGLPSVCYATDGIVDVLRNGVNGYLIEPGDVANMAERLILLLGDPSLRQRLGAAAAEIGPEFDIDGMVRSQENLYERLLQARGAPTP
ncbi:MAG: glycosyltransferase family 4 protein [Elusimicrobiota bacterium]